MHPGPRRLGVLAWGGEPTAAMAAAAAAAAPGPLRLLRRRATEEGAARRLLPPVGPWGGGVGWGRLAERAVVR